MHGSHARRVTIWQLSPRWVCQSSGPCALRRGGRRTLAWPMFSRRSPAAQQEASAVGPIPRSVPDLVVRRLNSLFWNIFEAVWDSGIWTWPVWASTRGLVPPGRSLSAARNPVCGYGAGLLALGGSWSPSDIECHLFDPVGIVVIRVFVSTGTKMAMVEQPDTQREDPTASGAPRVEILIDVRT